MDQFDAATELEMKDREFSIKRRRVEGPKATGHCLWCNETLADGVRWCDAWCRDQWDAYGHIRGKR